MSQRYRFDHVLGTQKYMYTNQDWLNLDEKLKQLNEEEKYNEAFVLFQDVRRTTGKKAAPYCWATIGLLFTAQC